MKIGNMRLEKTPARIRACATFTWEETPQDDFDMFFETDARFENAFDLSPEAFLLAGIYPAMRLGEKRIRIEGAICPELKEGLNVATGWMAHWYQGNRPKIQIEAADGFHDRPSFGPRSRAQMMSCGIDSLFTLWQNRCQYPADHRGFIRAGFFMYGFDMGNTPKAYESEAAVYERVRGVLNEIAREMNLDLIPVYTNARHLLVDRRLFKYQGHSASLAAVAHCFKTRFETVLIPSSGTYFNLQPWGSHPLIDPYYSSAEMRVLYDGLPYSRLEKVRQIVEWETALRHLRVCYLDPDSAGNCGTCPKCLQAMAALLVAGKLPDAKSFPRQDLPAALMRRLRPGALQDHDGHFPELIDPLRKAGRGDLARIIQWKLLAYRLLYRRHGAGDFIERLKTFDRAKLNGAIHKVYSKCVS
ncbi:MAG: hypothetical protein R6W75_10570 [Smithellaceae bacterium]